MMDRATVNTVCVLLAAVFCMINVSNGLTAQQQAQFVNFHNNVRRSEGSSNMQAITWSPTLANFAQDWSSKCKFQRGQGVNSSTLESLGWSQTLYAGDARVLAPSDYESVVVQLWLKEKNAYSYTNNTCAAGQDCGHYIKSVWAITGEIGCAYSMCSPLKPFNWTSAMFFVCFYTSRADYENTRPYLKGPPCSQCTSNRTKCNSQLCDITGDSIPDPASSQTTILTEILNTTQNSETGDPTVETTTISPSNSSDSPLSSEADDSTTLAATNLPFTVTDPTSPSETGDPTVETTTISPSNSSDSQLSSEADNSTTLTATNLPFFSTQLQNTFDSKSSTLQTTTDSLSVSATILPESTSQHVSENSSLTEFLQTTTPFSPNTTENGSETTTIGRTQARDCYELKQQGITLSGVYEIWLLSRLIPTKVFCDMTTDGGGWTVFQRRLSYHDFYFGWISYTDGFGNLEGNFWLGNENLYLMLNMTTNYTLRVDLTDFNGTSRFAVYDSFTIGSSSDKYRLLSLGNYFGTAGDAMSVSVGFRFSTFDSENYMDSKKATRFHGAWWYPSVEFTFANLNGFYYGGRYQSSTNDGVIWIPFKGASFSLNSTEMKFRPNFE